MQSNRFFFPPNSQMPYHPYQYQQHAPAQMQMTQQPHPSTQPNMPYQQGQWQPPYQGMATGQKSTTKNVMGYFQNDEGKFDFDKVMNTAGQISNTYQQVSPLVKGIGSFFTGG